MQLKKNQKMVEYIKIHTSFFLQNIILPCFLYLQYFTKPIRRQIEIGMLFPYNILQMSKFSISAYFSKYFLY